MSFFSKITSVVKKVALAPITVTKLQARVAGKLLTAASKVVPSATVFGSGRSSAPAATPAAQTRAVSTAAPMYGAPVTPMGPTAPAASPGWFSSVTAALNPTVPVVPAAAAAAPYGPNGYPAPYGQAGYPAPYPPAYPPAYQPTTYTPPAQSSYQQGGGGGEVYTGNAYDPDAPADDGYGMSPDDARPDDAAYYDGELGDATAIDYERHFSGAAGLAGWGDNLLSLAKGAASGALSSGAALLNKPTAEQLAVAKLAAEQKAKAAAQASGFPIMPVAIAGGVGLLGYMVLRKRAAAPGAVVSNPRRRRRSRR